MVNIAIIGYGYWGPNLVRNFSSTDNCKIHTVAELRQERRQVLNKTFPSIQTVANIDDAIHNPQIDAIVVATPVFTHFEIAKKALEQGKHVLLEKPMTSTVREAQELVALAEKKKKILMVDHTFLYTGAVQKIKELVDSGDIGTIKYFDSTRINLGLFQHDVNVLWDLAPHDISILNHILSEKPHSIQAVGISHTNNGIENIAYMTVNYNSDVIAHFNCSWTSPVKIRSILIGGSNKMILYNDLEPTEKVKVYETGYSVRTDEEKQKVLIDYRIGDIYVPKISYKEALSGMANDFIHSIIHSKQPVSNAQVGLEVVRMLQAAQQSIKEKGKEILL